MERRRKHDGGMEGRKKGGRKEQERTEEDREEGGEGSKLNWRGRR